MLTEAENIRQKLQKFLDDTKATPLSPDDTLLEEACKDVEQALNYQITSEMVRLAHNIFGYLGRKGLEKRIFLHRRYMNVAQDIEERFWSNWHLVDTMAVLRHNREAVDEQTTFYHWTSRSLTDDHVLQTLYDSTQALCWVREGKADDWFKLYFENLARLSKPGVSRYTQCCYVRTGAEIASMVDMLTEALEETERLQEINNDDPNWDYYVPFWCGVITTRLGVYHKQEDWSSFDNVAEEALTFVKKMIHQAETEGSVDSQNLAWVTHDVGVSLLWAKRYEQARYLLEVALKFRDMGSTHFFLSACIWASEKNRKETLYHLKMAQNMTTDNDNRGYHDQFFLEAPEFSDVRDDSEFLEALGRR